MLLSIVIPVYNVSQYVEKCIRSCYNQNIPISEYEIIVVNDGSKDDSLSICEKLQKEYVDLKIVSQENRGLSGARNTGLRHATGRYVWFVDSDDWIEVNCLQNIIGYIEKNDPDILWLGHDVIYNGNATSSFVPNKTTNLVSGEDLFLDHLNNLFYIWKFIYKRTFLTDNKLEFLEGILYEDLEFTPRALAKANTCVLVPNIYYHYLMREGSIINNISERNIKDRFFILDKLNNLGQDSSVSVDYRDKINSIIIYFIAGTVKMSARAKITLPPNLFSLLKNIKKKQLKNLKVATDFKLIKLNPSLYHFVYKNFYGLYRLIKKV